jgi:hypothetical protein
MHAKEMTEHIKPWFQRFEFDIPFVTERIFMYKI